MFLEIISNGMMELLDLIDYITPYLGFDDLKNLLKLNKDFQYSISNKYQRLSFLFSAVYFTEIRSGSGLCSGSVFFPRPSQLLPNKWYSLLNIININYKFEDIIYFGLTLHQKNNPYLIIWKDGLGFRWSSLLDLYDVQILLNGKDLIGAKNWKQDDYAIIKNIRILIKKKI